jgi:hypothetical protein
LESQRYGDDAPHIIAKRAETGDGFDIVLDDVYNGFDDLND